MNKNLTATGTTQTHDNHGFFAHLGDGFRERRAARLATRKLERDLASYTTPRQIDDLYALLDRYDETPQTRQMRNILARQRLVA